MGTTRATWQFGSVGRQYYTCPDLSDSNREESVALLN
jgi:hypothetical protein